MKSKSSDYEDQVALQEGVLKLRRKLARHVLKKRGNAIQTYRQQVAIEGHQNKQIVLRGYGTAVYI